MNFDKIIIDLGAAVSENTAMRTIRVDLMAINQQLQNSNTTVAFSKVNTTAPCIHIVQDATTATAFEATIDTTKVTDLQGKIVITYEVNVADTEEVFGTGEIVLGNSGIPFASPTLDINVQLPATFIDISALLPTDRTVTTVYHQTLDSNKGVLVKNCTPSLLPIDNENSIGMQWQMDTMVQLSPQGASLPIKARTLYKDIDGLLKASAQLMLGSTEATLPLISIKTDVELSPTITENEKTLRQGGFSATFSTGTNSSISSEIDITTKNLKIESWETDSILYHKLSGKVLFTKLDNGNITYHAILSLVFKEIENGIQLIMSQSTVTVMPLIPVQQIEAVNLTFSGSSPLTITIVYNETTQKTTYTIIGDMDIVVTELNFTMAFVFNVELTLSPNWLWDATATISYGSRVDGLISHLLSTTHIINANNENQITGILSINNGLSSESNHSTSLVIGNSTNTNEQSVTTIAVAVTLFDETTNEQNHSGNAIFTETDNDKYSGEITVVNNVGAENETTMNLTTMTSIAQNGLATSDCQSQNEKYYYLLKPEYWGTVNAEDIIYYLSDNGVTQKTGIIRLHGENKGEETTNIEYQTTNN